MSRYPRTLLRLFVGILTFVGISLTGMPNFHSYAADQAEQKTSATIVYLFEESVLSDNVFEVIKQSRVLSDESRFEYLKRWVMPAESPQVIRMEADYSPTWPVPGSEFSSLDPKDAGGRLVSPAIELINAAAERGRLSELLIEASKRSSLSPARTINHVCLLSMLSLAMGQSAEAEQQLRRLTELARSAQQGRPERDAEAIALWFSLQFPGHREVSRELAITLSEDARSGRIPCTERWKRTISAIRFQLDWEAGVQAETVKSELLSSIDSVQSHSSRLRTWLPVSRVLSETRGAGYPVARWHLQRGRVQHVTGHDHDYLYYVSPLQGNFVVEATTTTFGLKDIHLGFGNFWAGSAWDQNSVVHGGFRYDEPNIPLNPPLTRMYDTMRVRLDVQDGHRTTSLNGRAIYQKARTANDDPWLSIHSWWLTDGVVKNLRITGDPVVPDEIFLINPGLSGWVACFDESVGGQSGDWHFRESGSELYSRRRSDRMYTASESLLRYHRPMIEDGKIEYEFFYDPGQAVVHPVLDRLCMVLNPGGVELHWVTDGRHDPTSLGSDNISPQTEYHKVSGGLPLVEKSWNTVSIITKGNQVELVLNGQSIFERPLEASNLRTFGLFHWADVSEVRVRNMRWRGQWPKSLMPEDDQELADHSLSEKIGDRNALNEVLNYDFRNGLRGDVLFAAGADWEKNIEQRPTGIRLTRPGGNYTNYAVISPMVVSGDFDAIAEFEHFTTTVEPGGEGNIQIAALIDDERASECYLFRKHYLFEGKRREDIVQSAVFQKRGTDTQYSFFAAPPEESTDGKLRLVRRGKTLYYLYAERDSSRFEIVHQETVTRDDAMLRLVVGHHKAGATSVTWKSLNVRAESAFGASPAEYPTIEVLNQQRKQLPAFQTWDFRTNTPQTGTSSLTDFTIFGEGTGTYSSDQNGLLIDVSGSDNWTASGLTSRQQIEGDFDISLELDVLHLEPCKQNDESCVLLLTEFPDERKTTTETKFAIHQAGDRRAETQIRRLRRDGQFNYQELVSKPSDEAKLLRLARRGDVVYQVYQGKEDSAPQVIGAMQIGREPVSPGYLRALIHTGGANRNTIVRFRNLTIYAEKYGDQQGTSQKGTDQQGDEQ
ncbi:MAG: DUF1583 domain-containing protein [Planctomyces sp.]|nr:DUF1583 domain-containing protein [Planctomyces sp.]